MALIVIPHHVSLSDIVRRQMRVCTSLGFVNPTGGAHTNTIEGYWHYLKVYVYQLAQYMFAADNVDPFTMLLHIVAGIDWST